jgi:hypothetical protein
MANPTLHYTIVMCYSFSNEWLSKPPAVRRDYEQEHVFPLFVKFADTIERSSFDAEAFTTRYSDFMILETDDLGAYYFLMEELRASPMLTQGYVTIADVHIGVNNEYKQRAAA